MITLLDPLAKRTASPHVLSAIGEEACNLAIWERADDPTLASLLAWTPKDVRFESGLGPLSVRLEEELCAAGYPDTGDRAALIADIAELGARYGTIMQINAVGVRLAVVTTDSCRKFHADYVKARLITTYVGTGTQWIDAEDAARMARGENPQRIHTMRAGDVGLFKGKMWTQSPAIHRSPPIAKTGETRLMLVLDPPRRR